jgi:hypothetical protein
MPGWAPAALRTPPHAASAGSRRGSRNATARGPQRSPASCGAAACTLACTGAFPCWAARAAGGQLGRGGPRVTRRTARQKLQAACQRLTAGLTPPRHWPGREGYRRLPSRVQGHDNDDGLQGNARALQRFFERARRRVCTGRQRRGGKRPRCPWAQCTQGLDRITIARPRLTEAKQRRVVA